MKEDKQMKSHTDTEKIKKKCGYCKMRNTPRWTGRKCKRHTPCVTVTKIKLYTEEQLKKEREEVIKELVEELENGSWPIFFRHQDKKRDLDKAVVIRKIMRQEVVNWLHSQTK